MPEAGAQLPAVTIGAGKSCFTLHGLCDHKTGVRLGAALLAGGFLLKLPVDFIWDVADVQTLHGVLLAD
ncbi:hypothetical protein RKK42_30490 [Klebsiella pneumoniae]|nr:hypothetical protein [Klebsiella pneumoniae]